MLYIINMHIILACFMIKECETWKSFYIKKNAVFKNNYFNYLFCNFCSVKL